MKAAAVQASEELGPWTSYSSRCVEDELELGEHVILFKERQRWSNRVQLHAGNVLHE